MFVSYNTGVIKLKSYRVRRSILHFETTKALAPYLHFKLWSRLTKQIDKIDKGINKLVKGGKMFFFLFLHFQLSSLTACNFHLTFEIKTRMVQIPYAHHYNPQFVYFKPAFWISKTVYQGDFYVARYICLNLFIKKNQQNFSRDFFK